MVAKQQNPMFRVFSNTCTIVKLLDKVWDVKKHFWHYLKHILLKSLGQILGQSWDNLGTEKNNVNKGNKGNNEINVDEWEFLDSFDSAKLKDKDKDDLRKLDRNRIRQAIGWVCEQKKIRKTFIAAVIHAYNTEQTPENESSIPLGVPELKKFIDKINKRLEKRGIKERCDLNCETATIVMADMKRIGEKMGYVAHTHQIPISELRLLSTRKRIEENIKLLHRS